MVGEGVAGLGYSMPAVLRRPFEQTFIQCLVIMSMCLVGCSCRDKPTDSVVGPASFYDVSPAWSPNGDLVAFNRGGPLGPSTWGLFMIRSDGTDETRILDWPQSRGILTIDWSDRDWLLVSTFDETVYKVRPDGTDKTVLYGGPAQGASWSPDESQLVFRPGFELWLVDSAGTNPRLLDPADTLLQGFSLNPDWGSGGMILHLRYVGNTNDPVIAQINPLTLQVTILDSEYVGGGRDYPRWVDSSAFLFFRYEINKHPQIWRVDSAFATPRCLTCEDMLNEGGGEFAISPVTGEIVYANSKHGGLSIMEADGSNKRQLTWPGGNKR